MVLFDGTRCIYRGSSCAKSNYGVKLQPNMTVVLKVDTKDGKFGVIIDDEDFGDAVTDQRLT